MATNPSYYASYGYLSPEQYEQIFLDSTGNEPQMTANAYMTGYDPAFNDGDDQYYVGDRKPDDGQNWVYVGSSDVAHNSSSPQGGARTDSETFQTWKLEPTPEAPQQQEAPQQVAAAPVAQTAPNPEAPPPNPEDYGIEPDDRTEEEKYTETYLDSVDYEPYEGSATQDTEPRMYEEWKAEQANEPPVIAPPEPAPIGGDRSNPPSPPPPPGPPAPPSPPDPTGGGGSSDWDQWMVDAEEPRFYDSDRYDYSNDPNDGPLSSNRKVTPGGQPLAGSQFA